MKVIKHWRALSEVGGKVYTLFVLEVVSSSFSLVPVVNLCEIYRAEKNTLWYVSCPTFLDSDLDRDICNGVI